MNSLITKITHGPDTLDPSGINPHKQWMKLVFTFCLVALCLIAFSLYMLYQIKNEQIFQVTLSTQENPSLLKEKTLSSVTETFKHKADTTRELEANPIRYTDPSL